jgi:hypothetical protein
VTERKRIRPRNDDDEREIVATAINKQLGGVLHRTAALNAAWAALVALRKYVFEQDVYPNKTALVETEIDYHTRRV